MGYPQREQWGSESCGGAGGDDESLSLLGSDPDTLAMAAALQEARAAARLGEVPVGAVILGPDRDLLARAHNRKEELRDATAHAEILAIGQAADALGAWRLTGCTLYTTLEPCPMCAGAIVQARLERLVFGAVDPKTGAVESVVQLLTPGLFNHDVRVERGPFAVRCGALLQEFFQDRRGARRDFSGQQ